MKSPDQMEIAPGFTVAHWKMLRLDATTPELGEWQKAVEILRARIQCRFFDPVDKLIEVEQSSLRKMYGFSILAIDFLVLETLQAFREGIVDHTTHSARLFRSFLVGWSTFTACPNVSNDAVKCAGEVYSRGRCALHHSGSTGGAFLVRTSGPMVDFSNNAVTINRTSFHSELKTEFNRYLEQLVEAPKTLLRSNFLTKMNAICLTA